MVAITQCSICKHSRENIDGWKACCDAFPDGYPRNFNFGAIEKGKECNNGIGFEEIKKEDK